jgi:hypothetical protein
VSEHDEQVPAERGDIMRANRGCVGIENPLVCSFNLGLIAAGVSLAGTELFGLV